MKKHFTLALIMMCAAAFSADWYSSKEKRENLLPRESVKDTAWYSYGDAPAYVWTLKTERSTFFDMNDFGFEYPVNLHGISAYLFDSLCVYSYKIYDKDGVTLLYQSDPLSSIKDYNDFVFASPMVVTDDFWLSVVPQEDGLPKHVSTDVVDSDHSFYGAPGAWELFYKEDERYEWSNYVLVEPFTGTDIYAPIVRSVSGLQNFMNYAANITVSVQDVSGVVTPMTGQYDIGAGWVDFSLNMKKGTYLFNGQIPGQPNGTSGVVRFYMADTLANAQYSDEYTIVWGTDIPLLNENFENGFPPAGWTLQNVGAGFLGGTLQDGGFVHEGKVSAVHWDDSGAQDDWMITRPVALPSEYPVTLSFWQTSYWTDYYNFCEVSVSTDMINWTQIYTPPYITMDPGNIVYDAVWLQPKVTLSAWAGQTVYLGFHYVGDYNNQWYIDEVQIVLDNEIPEITNIYANTALLPAVGAYLDNPMEISLELSDYTGTASVVGHYTFDGGSTYTDLVFSNIKADQTWTASIPASATAKAGEIYFTLEDVGGVVGDTTPYTISFVADTGVSVVKNFSYGSPVFINEDMTLTLDFEDESAVASVQGYYSKDNWATETPVAMTASKAHGYTYTGTIPAETAETFAAVRFVVTDVPGNILNTPAYTVKWLEGFVLFHDDFDGSNPDLTWYTDGGTWDFVTNESHSAVTSLHDSPGGNYGDNLFSPVRTGIYDFSAVYGATMFLWAKIDLETGWDYTYLQATIDESSWMNLYRFNGEDQDWQFFAIDLGAVALQPSVRFRFRLVSDAAINCDGVYIDDVTLAVYSKDYSAPLIEYAGPEQITATDYLIPREFTIPVGLGDYTFSVVLKDISDISEVKVVYSVDGGAEQVSVPTVSSGPSGTYELTIPAQTAGSKVTYKVVATDNSSYKNMNETGLYMIRFGNFLYYQNGDDYVDYLDMIGNTPQATAQAVATRITMGPMDGDADDIYRADLIGITIDNYISTDTGYPSDPMYVHVWANEGGKPGADIITPIYTEQAATDLSSYEITYVDLRSFSTELSGIEGDVFVGYTSAGDVTNILYEVVASHITQPGYINFQRSWLGKGDLSALSWELDPASIYHISAVTGAYEFVGINENDNRPLTTKLYQNYPNPFNPSTTIKFSLAADSKVSLSVYNSSGQKVAELFNGDLKKGYHEREFDGSKLTSGVYYYTLKVNERAMTAKMIMLK